MKCKICGCEEFDVIEGVTYCGECANSLSGRIITPTEYVKQTTAETTRQAHEIERQRAWVAFAKTAMRSIQEENGVGLTDNEVVEITYDADVMLAEFDKRFG